MERSKSLLKALLGGVLATACAFAAAQSQGADYPSKIVRIVVPYPAGGMPDRVARDVGAELQKRLGQPVIIENKPGASGNIGFEYAVRQLADGYTLVLAPSSNLTTQKVLFKSLSYDPQTDFRAISVLVQAPQVLLVNTQVPATSVRELIALAKKQPDKLSFGTTLGAFSHFAGELLRAQAAIRFSVIPYQGSNLVVQDLIGGHVDMMFYDSVSAIPLIQSGKVRALGVAYPTRSHAIPDVPTMTEAGMPGFEAISWYTLVTRAGTPEPIVERLGAELQAIMKSPAMRKRYQDMGAAVIGSTPEEAAATVRSESAKWTAVISAAGIQPN